MLKYSSKYLLSGHYHVLLHSCAAVVGSCHDTSATTRLVANTSTNLSNVPHTLEQHYLDNNFTDFILCKLNIIKTVQDF